MRADLYDCFVRIYHGQANGRVPAWAPRVKRARGDNRSSVLFYFAIVTAHSKRGPCNTLFSVPKCKLSLRVVAFVTCFERGRPKMVGTTLTPNFQPNVTHLSPHTTMRNGANTVVGEAGAREEAQIGSE
jgi:hypothetical protein